MPNSPTAAQLAARGQSPRAEFHPDHALQISSRSGTKSPPNKVALFGLGMKISDNPPHIVQHVNELMDENDCETRTHNLLGLNLAAIVTQSRALQAFWWRESLRAICSSPWTGSRSTIWTSSKLSASSSVLSDP